MAESKRDTTDVSGDVCPSCGRTVEPDSPDTPFCSRRCRMADLGKWFSGQYTISRPLEQRDIESGD